MSTFAIERKWKSRRFAERALQRNEVEKLYAAAKRAKDRLIITILLETGLRVSEFAAIKEENVNRHILTVVRGKWGKPREVPLSSEAETALRGLFAYGGGAVSIPVRTIQGIVSRVGHRAGLAHPHPHLLRHTFAVECLRRKMTLGSIRLLMGHENIATTSIYLEMHPEEAHAEFRRLWKRGGKTKT